MDDRERQWEIWQDTNALVQALMSDVLSCDEIVVSHDTQLARRNLIRALLACVEGITWALKKSALQHQRDGHIDFPPGELALLAERTPDLDDKAEVVAKRAHLPLRKNIRFAIRTFAKSEGIDFELPVNEHGWSDLLRAIEVRDRLMHPKNIAELNVDDDDLRRIGKAADWWATQLGSLFRQVMASGLSKARGAPFPNTSGSA